MKFFHIEYYILLQLFVTESIIFSKMFHKVLVMPEKKIVPVFYFLFVYGLMSMEYSDLYGQVSFSL